MRDSTPSEEIDAAGASEGSPLHHIACARSFRCRLLDPPCLPNPYPRHLCWTVYIGEVRGDGQFDVVWKTAGTVPGEAWSDYLPGSKDIEPDWFELRMLTSRR